MSLSEICFVGNLYSCSSTRGLRVAAQGAKSLRNKILMERPSSQAFPRSGSTPHLQRAPPLEAKDRQGRGQGHGADVFMASSLKSFSAKNYC